MSEHADVNESPHPVLTLLEFLQEDSWDAFRAAQDAAVSGDLRRSEYHQGKSAYATEALGHVLHWAETQGIDTGPLRRSLAERRKTRRPRMLSLDEVTAGYEQSTGETTS